MLLQYLQISIHTEASGTDDENPKIKNSMCHLDKFFDLMKSHAHKKSMKDELEESIV